MRPKVVYARVDTAWDKMPGMHCGYFASLRDAAMFIKKTIREFGPPTLIVVEEEDGSRAFDISFLTKKCTFPRDSLEFVRQDKKIYNLTLRANAEGDKGIIICASYSCASYSTALCFFNRYWKFCTDEIEEAVEVWRRLERAIGPPVEGNFFGFKFNEDEQ
jgi:hypothetical protein